MKHLKGLLASLAAVALAVTLWQPSVRSQAASLVIRAVDYSTLATVDVGSAADHAIRTIIVGSTGSSLATDSTAGSAAGASGPQGMGRAINAEPTLRSNGQATQFSTDLASKLIVLPYANPENFVSGVTSAMTGTTSTLLIAAPASGLRNYVTSLLCGNSHATVGTFVNIQDGSGGATLITLPAGAVFGGAAPPLPTPLKQPTTATGLYAVDVTTGANVVCSAVGYKGA